MRTSDQIEEMTVQDLDRLAEQNNVNEPDSLAGDIDRQLAVLDFADNRETSTNKLSVKRIVWYAAAVCTIALLALTAYSSLNNNGVTSSEIASAEFPADNTLLASLPRKGQVVKGIVLCNGIAAIGRDVTEIAAGTGKLIGRTFTDQNGEFAIRIAEQTDSLSTKYAGNTVTVPIDSTYIVISIP